MEQENVYDEYCKQMRLHITHITMVTCGRMFREKFRNINAKTHMFVCLHCESIFRIYSVDEL